MRDLRYAARTLVKNPGTAIISVVALALGIGLTTAMFSIVWGALYRGLPFEEADRLMHLERNNLSRDIESMEVTIHDFVDWREAQTSFEGVAAYYEGTVNVAGGEGRPDRYDGAFISANAFTLLREGPALGRTFRPGEDSPDAEPVIILGHTAWRDRYGSDPSVIGRTVRVNGQPTTIIGVMPEGFKFPISQEVWVPLRMDPLELERGSGTTLEVFGRLGNGVGLDEAQAEFAAIASRLEMEYPETNEGVGAVIKPFTEEYIGEEPTRLLWVMLVAVFAVLLIACVNVANLLLARATSRTREMAVRTALGASRGHVVVQMLTEAFVLAAAGGFFGLGLGWFGVRAFNAAIVDTDPPFWIDIRIDGIAVLAVLLLVLLASVAAGIIPALQASGTDVNEVLKDESRGSSSLRMGRFSKGLVMFEIALSCGLLAAGGLTTKSILKLRNIDYQFDTENVFTARVGLFESDYPDAAARLQFYQELRERLEALPGARHASISCCLPGMWAWSTRFAVEGESYDRDQDYPSARQAVISPGYFETFEVQVLQGRDFNRQDNAESLPVALVNQSFVRKFFSGESPLGRRVRLGTSESEAPWLTIVGIVPDMHMSGHENEEPEAIYVPLASNTPRFMSIAVRVAGPPLALTPQVRDVVASIDQNLPIYWVDTLQGRIAQNTWFYFVFGTLFIIFGAVGLFLALIGLYGVMGFSVSSRTKEVGVRMALGAERGDVLKMILKQGGFLVGVGLTVGLLLALALGHGLSVILFDVQPFDPVILLGIVIMLTGTAMLASLIPARRATRVDPVVALQYE